MRYLEDRFFTHLDMMLSGAGVIGLEDVVAIVVFAAV